MSYPLGWRQWLLFLKLAWGSGIWISDSFAHEGVACLANPSFVISHVPLLTFTHFCWLILAFFAVYLTFPVSWVNLHWLEGGFPVSVGRSGSESFTSTPTNMWVKTIKATCVHGFSIMKLWIYQVFSSFFHHKNNEEPQGVRLFPSFSSCFSGRRVGGDPRKTSDDVPQNYRCVLCCDSRHGNTYPDINIILYM